MEHPQEESYYESDGEIHVNPLDVLDEIRIEHVQRQMMDWNSGCLESFHRINDINRQLADQQGNHPPTDKSNSPEIKMESSSEEEQPCPGPRIRRGRWGRRAGEYSERWLPLIGSVDDYNNLMTRRAYALDPFTRDNGQREELSWVPSYILPSTPSPDKTTTSSPNPSAIQPFTSATTPNPILGFTTPTSAHPSIVASNSPPIYGAPSTSISTVFPVFSPGCTTASMSTATSTTTLIFSPVSTPGFWVFNPTVVPSSTPDAKPTFTKIIDKNPSTSPSSTQTTTTFVQSLIHQDVNRPNVQLLPNASTSKRGLIKFPTTEQWLPCEYVMGNSIQQQPGASAQEGTPSTSGTTNDGAVLVLKNANPETTTMIQTCSVALMKAVQYSVVPYETAKSSGPPRRTTRARVKRSPNLELKQDPTYKRPFARRPIPKPERKELAIMGPVQKKQKVVDDITELSVQDTVNYFLGLKSPIEPGFSP